MFSFTCFLIPLYGLLRFNYQMNEGSADENGEMNPFLAKTDLVRQLLLLENQLALAAYVTAGNIPLEDK